MLTFAKTAMPSLSSMLAAAGISVAFAATGPAGAMPLHAISAVAQADGAQALILKVDRRRHHGYRSRGGIFFNFGFGSPFYAPYQNFGFGSPFYAPYIGHGCIRTTLLRPTLLRALLRAPLPAVLCARTCALRVPAGASLQFDRTMPGQAVPIATR